MRDLFAEDKNRELIINSFRLKGRTKHVFAMLHLLTITEPIEQDRDWWQLRAYLIAHDRDRRPQISIKLRCN